MGELKTFYGVHKSNHPMTIMISELDEISISHLISTYHNPNDDRFYWCQGRYHIEELYGELPKKKNWKHIDLGNIDLQKILSLDGKEFNRKSDNLVDRMRAFDVFIHFSEVLVFFIIF